MEKYNCPYCGSKKVKATVKTGKIHYKRNVTGITCSVYCLKCNARGPVASGERANHLFGDPISDYLITTDEIIAQAIELWNQAPR